MASTDAAHFSIGDVLATLREEFPDITISKIRFLESQGLIDPERTPSGYRKFYEPDVERLRWILRQQKEHFLPLKVIKGRLEALRAETTEAARGSARRARRARHGPAALPLDDGVADEAGPEASGVSLTRTELAKAGGLDAAQLSELEAYGLLAPATEAGGRVLFDEEGLAIARLAAGFFAHGIEPRHLRMYRQFAERESALFAQVLVGVLRQRNPEARARAHEELGELARLGRGLRTAYLRQAARELLAE